MRCIGFLGVFLTWMSLIVSDSCGQDVPIRTRKSPQGRDVGLFTPAEPLPLASSHRLSQIGQFHDEPQLVPLGTADVLGNGPYDLFVSPNHLFPFREFDTQGTPVYKSPIELHGERVHEVITGPDGQIYGIHVSGKTVQISILNKRTNTFTLKATSDNLDLPGGLSGGVAALFDHRGQLNIYSTIAGQSEYRPPGDHHSAEFMPFDGAGFWRGKIPRRILYHIGFTNPRLEGVESLERVGDGPGPFLFSVHGLTLVHLGSDRPPALVTSEKQAVFRYYQIDESTSSPGPQQFVNDEQHVALRHHVINPGVKSIVDLKTGMSNLIVGDTGRLWFYPFTGRFAEETGSPVYGPPRALMAEGMNLALGALPVISAGDVDGDGLVDFIAGNDAGELLFVRNIGQAHRPEFDHPVAVPVGGRPLDIKAGYRGSIQGPGEAQWGYTCPTLIDWDGDGRRDVVLNSIMADYQFLQQLPGEGGPAFSEPKPLYCDGLQLHLAWRCQPAITDWGTGGRLCMIALDEDNLLRMFWRVDNQNVERGDLLALQDGSPITANVDEAAGQTGRAKLVAHDWDADGAIDLLIGTSRGLSLPASKSMFLPSHYEQSRAASILWLRNTGTNEEPVFAYLRQLDYEGERIGLGIHSCSPAPVDLGRGVIDLLVGEEGGTVRYFPRETLSSSSPAD
ncbi:MAG: VCBS repeat-containing protein [Planctomycetaceae bacterium]|nr:VCBS repeat-containing protein [Planctomycetaceae bacterium]